MRLYIIYWSDHIRFSIPEDSCGTGGSDFGCVPLDMLLPVHAAILDLSHLLV